MGNYFMRDRGVPRDPRSPKSIENAAESFRPVVVWGGWSPERAKEISRIKPVSNGRLIEMKMPN